MLLLRKSRKWTKKYQIVQCLSEIEYSTISINWKFLFATVFICFSISVKKVKTEKNILNFAVQFKNGKSKKKKIYTAEFA